MKPLAALLLLAAGASASLSPWLAVAAAWLALAVLLLAAINSVRTAIEQRAERSANPPSPPVVIGWIERRGFVRMRGQP